MTAEQIWVNSIIGQLQSDINKRFPKKQAIRVSSGKRLAYAYEIDRYRADKPEKPEHKTYETDILIWEGSEDDIWIPRVVVECKLKKITTHDALTYSTKAATHKHVHPYLRYGLLVGSYGDRFFPVRLFRHGAYFDFMAVFLKNKYTNKEWADLVKVLVEEIKISREIQQLLHHNLKNVRDNIGIIHRAMKIY